MADKLIRANGNVVINDDRSSSTSSDRWDIGDVRASLLTRTQFQARNGTDWELLDGTDVTGSALDTLVTLGSGLLPDATGKFLRMEGGNAQALTATVAGTTQTDSTAKNGLSNSTSSISGGSAASSGAHQHAMAYQTTDTAGGGVMTTGGQSSSSSGTLSNAVSSAGGHTHTVTGTAGAQTITGDTETAPVNITVNYFVKIN
jgi:hypothetical protein